jgi:hypothetical protein
MHSIPRARQILVAIAAGAVLASALPAAADAAPFPPGPTAKASHGQASGSEQRDTKTKRRPRNPKPAPTNDIPAGGPSGGVRDPNKAPVEEPGRVPEDDKAPVEQPGRVPEGDKAPVEQPGRVPEGEPTRVPVEGPIRVEAELQRLRVTLGADAAVIGNGASLADRLESIRIAIAERNAANPPSLRVAVTMGPATLRVSEAGAARMRLFCKSGVAGACRGIAWLSTEDGDLVAQTTFRVKAGQAKRPQLAIPAQFRRDGLKLVATAAMRDASDTVWTASRQMTLAA